MSDSAREAAAYPFTIQYGEPRYERASSASGALDNQIIIPTTYPPQLPRGPGVSPGYLQSLDPVLEDYPMAVLYERMAEVLPRRALGLTAAAMEEVQPFRAMNGSYPQYVNVPLHHTNGELPTHVLALVDSDKPMAKMYAIHAEVYAIQCERIGFGENALILPHAIPYLRNTGRFEIALPLMIFQIPRVESFELIHNFLYDHDAAKLLRALLPVPIMTRPEIGDIQRVALGYAELKDHVKLVRNADLVYGVWSNVCTIGADIEPLWEAIEVAWAVVLQAMHYYKNPPPRGRR